MSPTIWEPGQQAICVFPQIIEKNVGQDVALEGAL